MNADERAKLRFVAEWQRERKPWIFDFDYLTACSPDRILALLDALDAAERDLQAAKFDAGPERARADEAERERDEARRERDAWRAMDDAMAPCRCEYECASCAKLRDTAARLRAENP